MIVGTAGHIDHGKSSIVRKLTGTDPDRLKEEKARGITIELGFAYLPRPSGETIGFIDVPGHERLVHTMLAGAAGIDLVLLVVAADDGVMPQTREHLAIIELLGISRGLVALSKSDLAGADRRAEVTAEIAALLAGTGLAGSDIVPVSTVTGEGMSDLVVRLDEAAVSTRRRRGDGRFRLAVDRTFSLDGAGTVVTGTALSGRIGVGDSVIVSPSGLEARVRSVHAQSATAQEGLAGQRCALALVGSRITTSAVARGDVVLDPTLHAPTRRIDARLRLLASERKPLRAWMPVKFHSGALEREAKVLSLRPGAPIGPGETADVQIMLAEAAALAAGDRFVLRDTSATRTIGGGVILDLRPPERHRTTPGRAAERAALARPDPLAALSGVLAGERGFADLTAYFRDRAAADAEVERAAATLDLVTLNASGAVTGVSRARWQAFAKSASLQLAAFHKAQPDLPGMGQERLRLALTPRLPQPLFAAALQSLVASQVLALDRSWVRLPQHSVQSSPEDEQMWARIRPLLDGRERFRPPRVRDLAGELSLQEAAVRRLLKAAARRGSVEEVAHDHFFLSDTVIEMADIARALAAESENGRFAVVAFRDRLDNGRKVAIQILEFFDRQGLTMRRGDVRLINPHKADLYTRSVGSSAADGP